MRLMDEHYYQKEEYISTCKELSSLSLSSGLFLTKWQGFLTNTQGKEKSSNT
jgi:hypothetical protein